jgi:Tripartite tricarboxylate transporter family receptor
LQVTPVCKLQVRWLAAVHEHLDNIERQQRKPQDAADLVELIPSAEAISADVSVQCQNRYKSGGSATCAEAFQIRQAVVMSQAGGFASRLYSCAENPEEVMVRRLPAPCCIGLVLAWIVAVSCNLAPAQGTFPSKPVKFLIPYPGGGSNDVLARIVGDKLQAKWGQSVIIENRTGGSGNIGAAAVAQAEPDGYTLLVSASPPLATNQSLYKQMSFNPEEFVPITVFGSVSNLVIVRNGLPVNSLRLVCDGRAAQTELRAAGPDRQGDNRDAEDARRATEIPRAQHRARRPPAGRNGRLHQGRGEALGSGDPREQYRVGMSTWRDP